MSRLTERDKLIIEEVGLFRCLTSQQVAMIFGMNIKVCQRRLRKLSKAGYLKAMVLPSMNHGKSPNLFYPSKMSESILNRPCTKPRLSFQLTHQQKNNELLIQIKNDFHGSDVRCSIMPEHVIRTFCSKGDIIPDGAIMLERKGKRVLFLLENCEGTEIVKSRFNDDIENKFLKYVDSYECNDTGLYERYFKAKFNRFRMLFIASSDVRLSSISKLASEYDEYGFIWITAMDNFLKKGIKASIWDVPAKGIKGKGVV